MSFKVITDSTSDMSPEIAAQHDIEVVPLSVAFGDETMLDGVLTQHEFFERMDASPQLPKTSQPPVGAFVEAYQRALEVHDQVLSVHISSKLSGTIESARQAAGQFAGRVQVIDSLNLSWALAYQVVEAAKVSAQGLTVDAAVERIEAIRDRVKIIVGLDSLENLAKGGRIGKVAAFLGSVLDIKVAISVDSEGAFYPVFRKRGEKAAMRATLDWLAAGLGPAQRGRFAVGYASRPERALELVEQIRQRFEVTDVLTYEAGSVICTHTGSGWGVVAVPE